MRTRIVFSLENRGAFAPFHYQFMIDNTIRRLVALGNSDEFRDFTEYNFSSLKGQIRVARGGVRFFSRRVTLVFSSPSEAFIDYFLKVLFDQPSVDIGNLQLIPEEAVREQPVAFDASMRLLCISPIILMPDLSYEEEHMHFVSPETEKFSDLLYESTMARMEASGRYTEELLNSFYQFQVIPDTDYLARMEESGKKYARIYPAYEGDRKIETRGYTFPFTMYAPAPVQEFIYQNGLGYFCDKGFGMIDLAEVVKEYSLQPIREQSTRHREDSSLYA